MPNWCYNNLTISGDKSEIAKFKNWLGDEPFNLQKIKPMPKELEDTVSPTQAGQEEKAKELEEKYGASNWYDWHIQNWGTKWDVEADFDDGSSTDDSLVYNFDSAWCPPNLAIHALGKLFPALSITLSYREDGCLFAGILNVNGDEVEDHYVDGGKDEATYRQFVIDEFGDDPMEDPFEEEDSK